MIYYNIGYNYVLFHIVYLFMHAVSETMVLGLLMLISMGWSLNYLSFGSSGRSSGFNSYNNNNRNNSIN